MTPEDRDDCCFCYCHQTNTEHEAECCRVCNLCHLAVRMDCYFEHVYICEQDYKRRHPPPMPVRTRRCDQPGYKAPSKHKKERR